MDMCHRKRLCWLEGERLGSPLFSLSGNCVKADTEGESVPEREHKASLDQVFQGQGNSVELLLALISMPGKRNVPRFSWVALGKGRDSFLPFEIIKEYESNHFQSYLCVGKPRCSG